MIQHLIGMYQHLSHSDVIDLVLSENEGRRKQRNSPSKVQHFDKTLDRTDNSFTNIAEKLEPL